MASTVGFTGVSFPFRVDPETGGVAATTTGTGDLSHIQEAIQQIIGINPRLKEYWHIPDFGANPGNLVWMPIDDTFAGAIEVYLKGGLRKWEDRVRFDIVTVLDKDSEGKAIVRLTVMDVITFARVQFDVESPT